MGARVWLSIFAICIGAVLAGVILFMAFGWVWATSGFFAALLALTVVAVGFGWFYDRREARRRSGLAA